MTHRGGRSDPGIVAVKPANKAEPSAAESVEPRTGTKGNADQQSTRQAQDWESVSQALARIRQAAKLRKKERFTSLLHHVSVDLLRLSFFALKKDAAPGVDGLPRGLARPGPPGSVSGTAQSATIHTESRWTAASDCDLRSGRQNRPKSGRHGAKRDLRRRFSWIFVWISPQAQPARRAGCVNGRDHHHKGELDTRSRHQKLFR